MNVSDGSYIKYYFINNPDNKNMYIFIHGLGAEINIFNNIIEGLLQTRNPPTILLIVLRGHFDSKYSHTYNGEQLLDRCALDIIEIINSIPNKYPHSIISHSLGTIITYKSCCLGLNIPYIYLIGPVYCLSEEQKVTAYYMGKCINLLYNNSLIYNIINVIPLLPKTLQENFYILENGNKDVLANYIDMIKYINLKTLFYKYPPSTLSCKNIVIFQGLFDNVTIPYGSIKLNIDYNIPVIWLDCGHIPFDLTNSKIIINTILANNLQS